jgi:uncharacterized protein YecE (DUF72 family)
MTAAIHIGTQGWNYDAWVGSFYPKKTSAKDMLSLYAKIFDTVEVDSTFYAIPSENSVRGWYEKTPSHFTFSVKLPSEITHKNRLRNSEDHLALFLNRMLLLKEKLACVLIQLPPDFSPSEHKALTYFLNKLPKDFQFAIEFRNPNWFNNAILEEIENCKVTLALIDGKWVNRDIFFNLVDKMRSSFAYVRWLGRQELTDYSRIQIDRSQELALWQEAFRIISQNNSIIYGYFNNHFQGHSPASSNVLKKLLNLQVIDPSALVIQPSLF